MAPLSIITVLLASFAWPIARSIELTICPTGCQCYQSSTSAFTVDCSNQQLSVIPLGIPNSTEELLLVNNTIHIIKADGKLALPRLHILDLSQNDLEVIEDGAFDWVASLTEMRLSNNKLRVVEDRESFNASVFRNLSLLREMDIRQNIGETYPSAMWKYLPSLEVVKLDGHSDPLNSGFSSLVNLKALVLGPYQTGIGTVGEEYFMNIKGQLSSLDASNCCITSFDGNAFYHLPLLQILILSDNPLYEEVNNMARGLNRTQIEHLDLSRTHIGYASDELIRDHLCNLSLVYLDLSDNRINSIPPVLSKCLPALQFLSLALNYLYEKVDLGNDFLHLLELRVLNVSRQHMYSPDSEAEDALANSGRMRTGDQPNLAEGMTPRSDRWTTGVNGEERKAGSWGAYSMDTYPSGASSVRSKPTGQERQGAEISELPVSATSSTTEVVEDAAKTRNSRISVGDSHICIEGMACPVPLPPKLQTVDLSFYGLHVNIIPELLFLTSNTLHNLYLSYNGISEIPNIVYCKYPMQTEVLDLSGNDLNKINRDFVGQDICNFKIGKTLLLGDTRVGEVLAEQGNSTFLWPLRGLKTLNLTAAEISHLHTRVFENQTKLQRLYLAHNSLSDLGANVDHMRDLQYLDLSDNLIECLSWTALGNLQMLALVTNVSVNLANNPLACSCDCQYFIDWMHSTRVEFTDINSYACALPDGTVQPLGGTGLALAVQKLNEQCMSWLWLSLPLTLLLLWTFFTTLAASSYRFRYQIAFRWYKFRAARRQNEEEDAGRTSYTYDAFVAYHHADNRWVLNDLRNNLEAGEGDARELRLCFHHRDFLPGALIVENITEGIENSRVSLLIVSRHAVQSNWWHLELNMATHRALMNRQRSVICIFLDSLPEEAIPSNLSHMLHTFTCLRWPQDERQRATFWYKLKTAIAKAI